MQTDTFIKIKALQKKYDNGFEALKNIDLDIKKGEFLVIIGPSGCGKSTLLRLIAGLEEITTGNIEIDNKIVNELSPSKRDIAMVFQSYALYPHLNVFNNIATPLYMKYLTNFQKFPFIGKFIGDYKNKQNKINEEVSKVSETLDIKYLLNKKPAQLSGGQRQRVAIGRAMVRHPKVFLMDEPLSNLDAKLRVHMRTEIAQLHRKLASTFVYVTHDQSEAMTLGNRIVMMHNGEILQIDTPDTIYNQPQHLLVAEFIGSPKINTFETIVNEKGSIVLFEQDLKLECLEQKNNKIIVAIRPEALKRANEKDAIRWRSKVYHKENLGAYILIYVEIEEKEKAILRIGINKDFNPEIGETFHVKPKIKHILVFADNGDRLKCIKSKQEVDDEN